jgi:hypothetical protein
MEPEGSLPHSQEPATCPYPEPMQRISPGQRLCQMFRNVIIFYGELLAPRPTPKLEDHPLSAVRDCLFNVFTATLHIRRPFLHVQPEDAACRGGTDRLIVLTGTDLSYWQRPTYHADKDRLMMLTGTDLWCWQGPTYHADKDRLMMLTGTDLSCWQGSTYRGDRDRLIMVTGTDLSWWQGPTYHGDRDRLMVTGTDLWWQGPTYGDRDRLMLWYREAWLKCVKEVQVCARARAQKLV